VNYAEASAATATGKPIEVCVTGGKRRYVHLAQVGDRVNATLFSTVIMSYYPDGRITLDTGGFETLTTTATFNALLPDGQVWKTGGVLYYHPYASVADAQPFQNGHLELSVP